MKYYNRLLSCSIYLIDHAWSYQLKHAKVQLEQVPNLLERMAALMDISIDDPANDKLTLIELVLNKMWR